MAISNAAKETWVNFALAAMGQVELPDDIEHEDEVADYIIGVATKVADSMLDEYEERFGGGGQKKRRTKSKRKVSSRDDDDDDDNDDD